MKWDLSLQKLYFARLSIKEQFHYSEVFGLPVKLFTELLSNTLWFVPHGKDLNYSHLRCDVWPHWKIFFLQIPGLFAI